MRMLVRMGILVHTVAMIALGGVIGWNLSELARELDRRRRPQADVLPFRRPS